MKISAEKYTGIEALHTANSFTTGHESHITLTRAYALGHSPIRTQRFYLYLEDIPLFVASQLVRSHVGVQWYQRSKRTDRGGKDFREVCHNLADEVYDIVKLIAEDEGFVKDPEWHYNYIANLSDTIHSLPDKFDRYAPTSLMGDMNAEAIINMSHKRLCSTASEETRNIWEKVIDEISKADPELSKFCVRPCVARSGICSEAKCCGFNRTELFHKQLAQYRKLFVKS